MRESDIESMDIILNEMGIKLENSQVREIAENFKDHLDMQREVDNIPFTFRSAESCDRCKRLETEIADLERQIETYKSSVKRRRNASHVYLDGDSVMYEH